MISCTISPQSPPVAPLSKYPTAARISALASSELANSQGHLTGLGESPVTTPRTHQGLEPLKNQMKPFASSRRTSPCWRIAISSSSASLPSIHSAWRRRALMACFESASGLIRPVLRAPVLRAPVLRAKGRQQKRQPHCGANALRPSRLGGSAKGLQVRRPHKHRPHRAAVRFRPLSRSYLKNGLARGFPSPSGQAEPAKYYSARNSWLG